MATLTITNLTAEAVYLADLYTEVPANSSIDVQRSASDLPRMRALQSAMADGKVSLAVVYSAAELGSGLQAPPDAIEAQDIAPVAAADAFSAGSVIRAALVAGGGGSPDDVEVKAVGQLPFKFRVIDAWAKIVTAVGASTLEVRTQAAGGGTLLASLDSAATGRADASDTASAVATPGATEGLFIRRSDDAVVGEVFILIRPET